MLEICSDQIQPLIIEISSNFRIFQVHILQQDLKYFPQAIVWYYCIQRVFSVPRVS